MFQIFTSTQTEQNLGHFTLVRPLREFEEWMRTGAKPPPPPLPKAQTIQRIVDENARNPPNQ
ncbi:hypothetical protein [Corynebacterium auriscanis]|uniref:hypothetical protein n=1 Tax=Corynebacterium auriscanis TaxID=99807 RepID=UPI00155AADE9|nr:hypothetical protein [Corynebacterium auriscanis]MCX2163073.1 hypothetical protein [Corynebacterium auriscanis]